MEFQRIPKSQNNLEKKKQNLKSHISWLHSYSNKKMCVWYWHKDKHTDQQNRMESSKINSCIYGKMIFNKDNDHSMKKRAVFSKNNFEKTGYTHTKE